MRLGLGRGKGLGAYIETIWAIPFLLPFNAEHVSLLRWSLSFILLHNTLIEVIQYTVGVVQGFSLHCAIGDLSEVPGLGGAS